MTRTSKPAAQRRDEILDVAQHLFITKGVQATSVEDILKEVGIAKGTLYYHFSSKEEILRSLISRTTTRAAQQAQAAAQKTLHKTKSARAARERANLAERLVNHLLLWWYRRHKPQKRSDIIEKFNKNLRYYTIAAITDGHLAVDIYLHGESPGSQWARSLKPGDIISAIGHYREHTEHLANGQTLLVADETAYPALAAILARWQNPTPPIILTLSHHAEEQAYFEDGTLPPGSRRIRSRYGDDLTTVLAGLPPINAAWGALEHETAKTIRHYLRHRDHLDGSHNRIKTYWKQ